MKNLILLDQINESANDCKMLQENIKIIKSLLFLLKDSQINFYKNLPNLIKECEEDLAIQLDLFSEEAYNLRELTFKLNNNI